MILVSIGEAAKSASLFKMGYLSPVDLQRLIAKGAVGDILCRYFDARGEMIDDEVQDRVIGIPMSVMEDQRKIVIGVAGGPSKVGAIHAALLKKYINVLITDEGNRGRASPPVGWGIGRRHDSAACRARCTGDRGGQGDRPQHRAGPRRQGRPPLSHRAQRRRAGGRGSGDPRPGRRGASSRRGHLLRPWGRCGVCRPPAGLRPHRRAGEQCGAGQSAGR